MSFRCEICNQPQKPGTKPKIVVVKTRHQEYYDETTGHYTYGYETEKEIKVCPECCSSGRWV
jgi:hypothetical protein